MPSRDGTRRAKPVGFPRDEAAGAAAGPAGSDGRRYWLFSRAVWITTGSMGTF